ncbi:MAG TPA: hypothetical protein VFO29_12640 [Candidatus Rubrimentiphilum sp.]|nr:hypothetical protein [Candidatus Rubrimentiphilum sp.]
MARARKGGDPGAKRFQATLANLKHTRPKAEEAAAPAPEPAEPSASSGQVVAQTKQVRQAQAKTKLR